MSRKADIGKMLGIINYSRNIPLPMYDISKEYFCFSAFYNQYFIISIF